VSRATGRPAGPRPAPATRTASAWLRRLLVLLPLAALGCSGTWTCGAVKRLLYESPWRDSWQKPDRVVAALGVEAGDHVADLGAGGGYFTFPLAEAVGSGGRVYALDVDESLLAYVRREARRRELPQVVTLRSPEDGPGLEPHSVDLVFLSNVFHHLPAPADYFANARPVLRSGGRVAVIEVARDSFPGGHATPPEEIAAAMQAAGYVLVESHAFLERQSFQVFAPRGP
jgi:ubiquinone/menaquinone biosynthesis C-methylase UbiE